MSDENTRQNPFQTINEIVGKDRNLSYGERLIIQTIGVVAMEIIGYVRLYSGETTEGPEALGDDGLPDEFTASEEEADEVAEALDNDNGDESTVRSPVSESTA